MSQPIKRILIAVDLVDTGEAVPQEAVNAAHILRDPRRREAARRLIDEVVPLAQVLGASIEIVYVRETRAHQVAGERPHADEVDDWIDDHLEKLAQFVIDAGVSCLTASLDGSVPRALVAHAKKTSPISSSSEATDDGTCWRAAPSTSSLKPTGAYSSCPLERSIASRWSLGPSLRPRSQKAVRVADRIADGFGHGV